jgi:alpha-ketoglutarate-dependent taurine dioxygenase
MQSNYKTIRAAPLGPAIGAEISGIDIAAGIDDAQFAELRQAFVDYGMIFLRGQDITPQPRIAFAEGCTRAESQALLDYLYAHARRNEFTCRFRWRKGSLAIRDNRASHHCALNDYHGERRLMHRITIDGEDLAAHTAH